tara:strand:- start:111 stop:500 length:390 start_codon:yes stop_codon:yes gene_type:complete
MAGFSDFLETKVLQHVFGASAYSAPSTLYISLYTAAPTDSGGGTEVSTSGTAYARQSGAFTVTGNTASNTANIEYATATANYGTVVAMGIHDAATGGNLLAYGSLTTSKSVSSGDVFRFNASAIDITLT